MEKIADQPSKIKRFFLTGARFLFEKLVDPLSTSEDDRRHESILNILLLCSIGLSLTCSAVVIIDLQRHGHQYDGVPWWLVSLICVIFTGLLLASRSGFFRISAYVLLALYVIPLIYMTTLWGMDLPQGLLLYALLIIMSSVLISTRFSLFFTCALLIYFAALATAFNLGLWIPDSSWREHAFVSLDGVVFIITFAAISAVSWLSNREIEKSLTRARRSEAELKAERDNLEIKVQERTNELRNVQAAQMSQLHRFVEFGRLASGLFHDLASPLTAVALNLESLKDESSPAGRARQHIEQALRATKGLENFIGAARKQLQTQEYQVTFDIVPEIHEVVSVLSHKAKKSGVEIKCQLPVALTCFGNPLKFHQIIANLISNAIDSYQDVPAGLGRKPVIVSLVATDEAVTLNVTDSGCGIDKSQQARVFEPFFTTKGVEFGMGIGLSSTKNIVEKDFHGTISFTSVPKRGTSFTVSFPQAAETTPPRTR